MTYSLTAFLDELHKMGYEFANNYDVVGYSSGRLRAAMFFYIDDIPYEFEMNIHRGGPMISHHKFIMTISLYEHTLLQFKHVIYFTETKDIIRTHFQERIRRFKNHTELSPLELMHFIWFMRAENQDRFFVPRLQ